jgi:hypothetical protein
MSFSLKALHSRALIVQYTAERSDFFDPAIRAIPTPTLRPVERRFGSSAGCVHIRLLPKGPKHLA